MTVSRVYYQNETYCRHKSMNVDKEGGLDILGDTKEQKQNRRPDLIHDGVLCVYTRKRDQILSSEELDHF